MAKVIKKGKPASKPVKAAPKKAKPAAKAAAKKTAKPAPKKAAVKAKAVKGKPVAKKAAKPVKAKAPVKKPAVKAKAPAKKVKAPAKPVKKSTPKQIVKSKPVKAPVKKTEPAKKAVTKPAPKPVPASKPVSKAAIPSPAERVPAGKPNLKPEIKPAMKSQQKNPAEKIQPAPQKHVDTKPLMEVSVVRYPDADLAMFKEVILKKIAKAKEEIDFYSDQIKNSSESETQFASIDDGSMTSERENMNQIVVRMQKLISHLESALVRIENKSYGICRETGRLIPKERLLVVPHATLSVEGKKMEKK
jgi:RNA polymerase-binding transcription factor DksA